MRIERSSLSGMRVSMISSLSTLNFYCCNLPAYYSFKDNISYTEAFSRLQQEAGGITVEQARSLEYTPVIKPVVRKHLTENFLGYTVFHTAKAIPFFLSSSLESVVGLRNNLFINDRNINIESSNLSGLLFKGNFSAFFSELFAQWWICVERLVWLVICLLALIPLFIKKYRSWAIFLWLIILYFAILTGPVSYARYRLPAEPFLFLLASFAIIKLYGKYRTKKQN